MNTVYKKKTYLFNGAYLTVEKNKLQSPTWTVFPGGSVVKNLPAVQETQETWVWSVGWEDPLEKEMATHSSILAWEIPWTQEPGRPQSMESQKSWTQLQFSSVTQSCPILCDPMNHSTPGLPIHHQLPESTQTHIHWVGDAIQPSQTLSSPSPPALNLSQHQGLLKWVSSSH